MIKRIEHIATKDDLVSFRNDLRKQMGGLKKYMFFFWIMQMVALYAILVMLIKR